MGFLTSSIIASAWIIFLVWRWDAAVSYIYYFIVFYKCLSWILKKLVEFGFFVLSCVVCHEILLYIIHFKEEREKTRIHIKYKQNFKEKLTSTETADMIEIKLRNELSSHWKNAKNIWNELSWVD